MHTYRQTLDWVCLLLYTMEVYVMSMNTYTLWAEITRIEEIRNPKLLCAGSVDAESFEEACSKYEDTKLFKNDNRKIFGSYEDALVYSADKLELPSHISKDKGLEHAMKEYVDFLKVCINSAQAKNYSEEDLKRIMFERALAKLYLQYTHIYYNNGHAMYEHKPL